MSFKQAYEQFHEDKRSKQTDLPMRGVVSTVITDIESVTVNMAHTSGTPRIVIRHPYYGVNSWIRTMPEPGTQVLTQRRGDLHKEELFGYISNTLPRLIKEAKERGFLMRRLNQGEIEVRSSGRAYQHWGDAGDLEMRGGVTELDLSTSRLEISSLSPTHKRRMTFHDPTALGHEERLGLVRRPDPQNQQAAPALQKFIRISAAGEFAQEYIRLLNRENGDAMTALQEGDVVDASGQLKKHPTTNKNLRYERLLHHKQATNILAVRVDEALNVQLVNSFTGNTETDLKFGSNNTLKVNTKILNFTATNTGQMNFNNSLTIKSNQVSVASSNVSFGNNAVFKFVIGTSLVNSILTPLFSILISVLQTLAAESALSGSKVALTGAATSLTGISTQLQSTLSNQVSLSG